jgi:hypothetical protein
LEKAPFLCQLLLFKQADVRAQVPGNYFPKAEEKRRRNHSAMGILTRMKSRNLWIVGK